MALGSDSRDDVQMILIALPAWIIPRIFILVARYRLALEQSPDWQGEERQMEGLKTIKNSWRIAVGLILVILTGSAIGISLPTRDLDEHMRLILAGVSRLGTAVIVFLLSLEVPQWLGVYDYLRLLRKDGEESVGKTTAGLRFNVIWDVLGYFVRIYFVMILFFCGPRHGWSIPVALIIGIFVGVMIYVGMYYTRTAMRDQKVMIAYGTMAFLVTLSVVAFGFGLAYIERVWYPEADNRTERILVGVGISVAFVLAVIIHAVAYRISHRQLQEKSESMTASGMMDGSSSPRFNSILFRPDNIGSIEKSGGTDSKSSGGVTRMPTASLSSIKESTSKNSVEDIDLEEEPREAAIEQEYSKEEAVAEKDLEAEVDVDEEDEVEETCCNMCYSKMCCSCCCCRKNQETTWSHLTIFGKIALVLFWIVRVGLNGFCFYVVIINIGASVQGKQTKKYFPRTDEILYEHMNEGPVCAYSKPFSDDHIGTFDSNEAALAANHTVAHCGACGACSTWQNLRIEWTTRHKLADLSAKCATKLLFSSFEKVVQCHMDTIGFDRTCSECWVRDEQCAVKNCVFIHLQSTLVNQVGNFAVGPNQVTSALCEEAMCELEFVPCSGASRRRMNIESGIKRPANQQCRNVLDAVAKWTGLFGD